MRSKFVITNIGKVPAFVSTDITAEADGKQVNIIMDEVDVPKGPIVLMPGQIARRPGFFTTGPPYQQVLRGDPCPQVYQRILVKYSDDKYDMDRYFISYRVKFQPKKIPKPILFASPQSGLWTFEEADFK
jgi:hypothetical protein